MSKVLFLLIYFTFSVIHASANQDLSLRADYIDDPRLEVGAIYAVHYFDDDTGRISLHKIESTSSEMIEGASQLILFKGLNSSDDRPDFVGLDYDQLAQSEVSSSLATKVLPRAEVNGATNVFVDFLSTSKHLGLGGARKPMSREVGRYSEAVAVGKSNQKIFQQNMKELKEEFSEKATQIIEEFNLKNTRTYREHLELKNTAFRAVMVNQLRLEEVRDFNLALPSMETVVSQAASIHERSRQLFVEKDFESSIVFSDSTRELLDMAVGIVPIAGWAKDLIEVTTGYNYILGRELSLEERAFSLLSVATMGYGAKLKVFKHVIGKVDKSKEIYERVKVYRKYIADGEWHKLFHNLKPEVVIGRPAIAKKLRKDLEIPDAWELTYERKKKGGIRFIKPNTANGTYVRIKGANPLGEYSNDLVANVRLQKAGRTVSVLGEGIELKTKDAHILLEGFKVPSWLKD